MTDGGRQESDRERRPCCWHEVGGGKRDRRKRELGGKGKASERKRVREEDGSAK